MNGAAKNVAVIPAGTEGVDQSPVNEVAVVLSYGSLHDLVGPANQVCSLASLLTKQYGDRLGPEAQALFDLIQGSVGRLQNLLAGVRAYAQIVGKQTRFENCDTGALLAATVSALQPMIEETGAQITYDSLPPIHGDPAQIGFIFRALLENSMRFRGEQPPAIHVSSHTDEETVTISVRDNGIGIHPKNHKRIFDLFKRVHNEKYPGAGVGLAAAGQILQRHGGKIWVDSDIGRGATFFFSVPRHEPAQPRTPVDRRTAE